MATKKNNKLASLNAKPSEEVLESLERLEDKSLPGTSATRKAVPKAANKAPALKALATRQPYSKAVTTRAVSRMASGKNASPTGTQAARRKSGASKEAESPLQRRMQEIREGKRDIPGYAPNPNTAVSAPAETTRQEPGPSTAVTLERRKGTKEEIAEWKALSRGLSGTRVKKFWKLINEGLSGPEAREEATKGYIPNKAQTVAKQQTSQKPKMGKPGQNPIGNRQKPQTQSYAKALACVKMAVFAKDAPVATLTREQLTWISESILDRVLEEENVKVKFRTIAFKPEALCIDCANKDSAEWLAGAVTALAGWTGPQLMATTADRAPKHTIAHIVFPRAADKEAEGILKMLDHQNEGLRVGSWKVVKQQTEGEAKRLVVYMDDQSLEAVKKENMELSYRYGTVKVHLRQKQKAPEEQDSDPENGNSAKEGESSEAKMEVESNQAPQTSVKAVGTDVDHLNTQAMEVDLQSDLEKEEQGAEEPDPLSDEA